MNIDDILKHRLHNHQLSTHTLTSPEDVVAHLGAVQSQDFAGAKWAIGQRLENANDQLIEDAFTDGKIIRTHVLRPTWHFVHSQDIGWMLQLTGQRVKKAINSYNKQLELNDEVFQQTQKIIIKLLTERKQVIRDEIKEELEKHKITTNVQRLAHIVMQAEQEQIICSGPRRGKQFTYVLFSERVSKTKTRSMDEALAELTKRYFTSHGPATIKDFVWWSGLTVADAKIGLDHNSKNLATVTIEEKEYYFSEANPPAIKPVAFFLPNYDEYTVAYKDRDAYFNPDHASFFDAREGVAFWNTIIFRGKSIASWRKEQKKNSLHIEYRAFEKLTTQAVNAISLAAKNYGEFLGLETSITHTT